MFSLVTQRYEDAEGVPVWERETEAAGLKRSDGLPQDTHDTARRVDSRVWQSRQRRATRLHSNSRSARVVCVPQSSVVWTTTHTPANDRGRRPSPPLARASPRQSGHSCPHTLTPCPCRVRCPPPPRREAEEIKHFGFGRDWRTLQERQRVEGNYLGKGVWHPGVVVKKQVLFGQVRHASFVRAHGRASKAMPTHAPTFTAQSVGV